jgi:hypothetical protein
MMNQQLPLAVHYEHPEWFRPLFAEMDRRSIQYLRIDAGCHVYDATATDRKYAVFFNRMSASAYLRGNAQGIFFTRDYLAHLDRIGTRVTCVKAPGRKFLYAIKGLCRDAPRETVMRRARKTSEDNRTRGTHTIWYLFRHIRLVLWNAFCKGVADFPTTQG